MRKRPLAARTPTTKFLPFLRRYGTPSAVLREYSHILFINSPLGETVTPTPQGAEIQNQVNHTTTVK